MTIRRHVDLSSINEDFMCFEVACSEAPEGMFLQAREIRDRVLGYSADEFLRVTKSNGLETDNCDGIREVEALMFDLVRKKNPDSEIEAAIGLGRVLRDAPSDRMRLHGSKEAILDRLQRDRDFINSTRGPSFETIEDVLAIAAED